MMLLPGAVAASQSLTGAVFDPLTSVAGYQAVWWAENPGQTFPSNGVELDAWNDASGSARHLINGEANSTRPAYATSVAGLNNKPAVLFDSANFEYLAVSWTAVPQPMDWFIILKQTTVNAGTIKVIFAGLDATYVQALDTLFDGSWWGIAPDGNLIVGTVDTAAHSLFIHFDGASSYITLDGTTTDTGTESGGQTRGIVLGKYFDGSLPWGGHVAFLACKQTFTSQEKANLIAWSKTHYTTP